MYKNNKLNLIIFIKIIYIYMFELIQDTTNLPLFMGQTIIIICSALPIVLVDRFFQNYRDKYESNMPMRNMFNFIQVNNDFK